MHHLRLAIASVFACAALTLAQGGSPTPGAPARGSITTGVATSRISMKGVPESCSQPVNVQPGVFPVSLGTLTSPDGRQWTAPAPVNEAGAVAVDLFNNCTGPGDNPGWASQLKTVVVDEDGVEITGYIFADNYFELWVNGRFIARDSIPMTPFNSSVVRFKARYPMTVAIMAVDWETHVGLGLEYPTYNVGDGGFIAYFSDGNGTSGQWRAETFTIAPLDDPGCVRVTASGRDSSACGPNGRPKCAQQDPNTCRALRFPLPADWTSGRFDDRSWPTAVVWPASAVTNQRGYTDYARMFGDAEFIWTRNLLLDNLVLARYTATGPRRQ